MNKIKRIEGPEGPGDRDPKRALEDNISQTQAALEAINKLLDGILPEQRRRDLLQRKKLVGERLKKLLGET